MALSRFSLGDMHRLSWPYPALPRPHAQIAGVVDY